MKAILYAAAALMMVASIYGFIDYSKTGNTKEFQTMYDDKTDEAKNEPEVQPVVSRKEVVNETPVVAEKPAVVKEVPAGQIARKTTTRKKAKISSAKRKINYKSFSRAPIREVIEIPKVKTLETEGQDKSIQ